MIRPLEPWRFYSLDIVYLSVFFFLSFKIVKHRSHAEKKKKREISFIKLV